MQTVFKYLVAIGFLTLSSTAFAQEEKDNELTGFPAATPAIILWSAKACYAEALWSEADCAALLHVIRKRSTRYHWPFLKMLKEYSVVNWIHSTQGKKIKYFKLEANRRNKANWNKSWFGLVSHVVDIFNGRVQDPCPIANHWAAPWYKPKSKMRKVRCNVKTANQFWVSK